MFDPAITPVDLSNLFSVAKWLSIVSLILALFPTLTFFSFKNEYPARLPVNFCIASIGINSAFLVGIFNTDACYSQAILIQLFACALVCWWFIISLNVYLIVNNKPYIHLERYYLISGWLLPVVFTVIPMVLNVYQTDSTVLTSSTSSAQAASSNGIGDLMSRSQPSNSTVPPMTNWECWLSDYHGSAWPTYFFLYGWMGLAICIGIPLWVLSLKRVYHLHYTLGSESSPSSASSSDSSFNNSAAATTAASDSNDSMLSPALAVGDAASITPSLVMISYVRHLAFMIIFMAVFVVAFVYRWVHDFGTLSYTLMMMHTVSICSLGIYCFFVFGASKRNFQLWRDAVTSYFCPIDSSSDSHSRLSVATPQTPLLSSSPASMSSSSPIFSSSLTSNHLLFPSSTSSKPASMRLDSSQSTGVPSSSLLYGSSSSPVSTSITPILTNTAATSSPSTSSSFVPPHRLTAPSSPMRMMSGFARLGHAAPNSVNISNVSNSPLMSNWHQ